MSYEPEVNKVKTEPKAKKREEKLNSKLNAV